MNKRFLTFALLFVFATAADAATDFFRLSWRDDPATTMVIGWRQNGGSTPVVHYGTTDYGVAYASYPLSATPARTTTVKGMTTCFARLTGLQPDTAYYFVVRDSSGVSARKWFRTAPNTAKDFSFIMGGDSRDNRTPRQQANQMVAKLRPLFVMFGGDYTANNTDTEWADWLSDWQQTTSADGRMYPIVATRGNHDDNLSLVDLFDIPSDNVYYALPVGGSYMRLYTLNSEIAPGGTQQSWLISDLSSNASVKWKIAQYHRPMFPHSLSKAENTSLYSSWAQTFYGYGMTLVCDSDSHTVKTTWPVRPTGNTSPSAAFVRDDTSGTVYVGEGCWGAPLRAADDLKPYTRDAGSFNMLMWVHARSSHLELRTITVATVANVGTVSDSAPFALPANLSVWSPSNGDVISLYPTATAAPLTASFQQGANGYAGATDALIRSDNVATNYGTDTLLNVDGNPDVASLLRFDLSSLSTGATVTSGTLSVRVTNASPQVYEIYALRRPWAESSVTWNSASTGVAWGTVGADNTSTDRESAPLGTFGSDTTGWKTYTLNAAGISKVQSWIASPSSNYGFVVQDFANDDSIGVNSKEATTAADRPKLTVTYYPPAPAAPTTVSFQQGVGGYGDASDALIRSDNVTTNYGADTLLNVDGSPDVATLLRFGLSSIPVGKTVTSVTLSVRLTNESPQTYQIYALRRAWTESSVTWNSASTGVAWGTAGADNTSTDRESALLGTFGSDTIGWRTYTFNAAGIAKVQSWIDSPSSNHGFVIQNFANDDSIGMSSKEATTASNRPMLTITYQ